MATSIPDWPRMLRRATAAAYCDMSVPSFEREVAEGRLPMGVMFGGQLRWSRALIDEALERISGEAVPDWRARSGLYGTAA